MAEDLRGERWALLTLDAWTAIPRGAERDVYIALLLHADADGYCWPTVAALAEVAGHRRRGVQEALRSLEAAGWIARASKGGGRSKGSTWNVRRLSRNRHGANKPVIRPDTEQINRAKTGIKGRTPVHPEHSRTINKCTVTSVQVALLPRNEQTAREQVESLIKRFLTYRRDVSGHGYAELPPAALAEDWHADLAAVAGHLERPIAEAVTWAAAVLTAAVNEEQQTGRENTYLTHRPFMRGKGRFLISKHGPAPGQEPWSGSDTAESDLAAAYEEALGG